MMSSIWLVQHRVVLRAPKKGSSSRAPRKESSACNNTGELMLSLAPAKACVDEKQGEELVSLRCAFKHRFSDFIVNEIDLEGEVVWFKPETDL